MVLAPQFPYPLSEFQACGCRDPLCQPQAYATCRDLQTLGFVSIFIALTSGTPIFEMIFVVRQISGAISRQRFPGDKFRALALMI